MKGVGLAAAGASMVERGSWAVTRGRLRVLAYHRIEDRARFGEHLDHLCRHYSPVTAEQVIGWAEHGQELPTRPVWLTFDDGYADVVGAAELLAGRRITATLMVCPAVAEGEVAWFETARAALASGWRPTGAPSNDAESVMEWLKQLPDSERRAAVAGLEPPSASPFATVEDLRRWVELGHHLGNHTWDHPCLDMCEPDQQRWQITEARRWIDRTFAGQPRVFAYPNGNRSTELDSLVTEVGERIVLSYDQRLARRADPLVSRLGVEAWMGEARLSQILSGLQLRRLRDWISRTPKLADRYR